MHLLDSEYLLAGGSWNGMQTVNTPVSVADFDCEINRSGDKAGIGKAARLSWGQTGLPVTSDP